MRDITIDLMRRDCSWHAERTQDILAIMTCWPTIGLASSPIFDLVTLLVSGEIELLISAGQFNNSQLLLFSITYA